MAAFIHPTPQNLIRITTTITTLLRTATQGNIGGGETLRELTMLVGVFESRTRVKSFYKFTFAISLVKYILIRTSKDNNKNSASRLLPSNGQSELRNRLNRTCQF